MYPLNVILAGVGDSLEPRIQSELAARGAEVEGAFPTAEAVVDRFFAEEKPAMRLVVVHGVGVGIAAAVRLLRERFPAWPILALVGSAEDPGGWLAVNRAGADQVVGLPLKEGDFCEAVDSLAGRFRPAGHPTFMLAVSGVVPGAGATTLATALAGELSAVYGSRTLLLEAALRMGVLAMHLNVQPNLCLSDLLAEADKLDAAGFRKALTAVAPHLDLLAAQPDLARTSPDPVRGVLKIVDLAREAGEVVVVDLPCTFDDLHFEMLWAANQVVLVGDQSLPAVRTMRMILDAAARTKTSKRVHIVLNKYDPGIESLTASKISETLGGVDVLTVPNDYATVMQSANEGRLLRDYAPDSPVLASVRTLARGIMGEPRPQPHHKHSFLSRLRELFHPVNRS